MYKRIMVPVDLRHTEQLEKALATAADLASHYGASAVLVSVTAPPTSDVAHDPEEFVEKLNRFAAEQSRRYGVEFAAKTVLTPDPAVELNAALRDAIRFLGADLVVMASHVPTIWDYLISSHAGHLASHADVSVLVVR